MIVRLLVERSSIYVRERDSVRVLVDSVRDERGSPVVIWRRVDTGLRGRTSQQEFLRSYALEPTR